MRLIDADKIQKELDSMIVEGETFTTAVEFAKLTIKDAPTVDAEPVVRCKDCFHFAPGTEKFDAFCVHNSVPVDEDGMGFCSDGVNKTELLDDPMEGEEHETD